MGATNINYWNKGLMVWKIISRKCLKTASGITATRFLRWWVLLLPLLLLSLNLGAEPMNESEEAALRGLDLQLLATVIFLEARDQPEECRIAVGYVVLNRVKMQWLGNTTISGVILAKYQFTPIHAGTIREQYSKCLEEPRAWHDAQNLALLLIAGQLDDPTEDIGGANHFISTHPLTDKPLWANTNMPNKVIGEMRFFSLPASRPSMTSGGMKR